jgi:DNA-binding response OmpR family regulator
VPNNTVLLVEDDPELRLLLTTILELDNRQVIGAGNGEEALRLARQHDPGVIVLEHMLPRMSGEQFREAQLANGTIKNIPVVVVSAHPHGAAIARRMKVEQYLPKPVDFDALTRFVSSRLGADAGGES